MPKLPQVNVRVPNLWHDLIRRIAQRLRDDASFGVRLEEMLDKANPVTNALSGLEEDASPALARLDTDVLQSILDRLDALEEREPRMVRIEALELRVATLETTAGTQAAPPGPAPASNRPIPVEHLEEAARLWDGGKGPSFQQIIASKGWPYNRAGLYRAVKRYLEPPAGLASHVDENPEPPED